MKPTLNFVRYGCDSEVTTSAFPAVTEVLVEINVKEVLHCVTFSAHCFAELVAMH